MNGLDQYTHRTNRRRGSRYSGFLGIYRQDRRAHVKGKAERYAASAQIQVIKMLQGEIHRLSGVNEKLINTLQKVQIENTKMRNELVWLHDKTDDMHQRIQVISLRKEDTPFNGDDRRKQ